MRIGQPILIDDQTPAKIKGFNSDGTIIPEYIEAQEYNDLLTQFTGATR